MAPWEQSRYSHRCKVASLDKREVAVHVISFLPGSGLGSPISGQASNWIGEHSTRESHLLKLGLLVYRCWLVGVGGDNVRFEVRLNAWLEAVVFISGFILCVNLFTSFNKVLMHLCSNVRGGTRSPLPGYGHARGALPGATSFLRSLPAAAA